VLKVQGGESVSVWKLSKQQKKGGLSLVIGLVLLFFAYTRYTAGDIQGTTVIGGLGVVAILLGLRG
jgi:hypothetical protein